MNLDEFRCILYVYLLCTVDPTMFLWYTFMWDTADSCIPLFIKNITLPAIEHV